MFSLQFLPVKSQYSSQQIRHLQCLLSQFFIDERQALEGRRCFSFRVYVTKNVITTFLAVKRDMICFFLLVSNIFFINQKDTRSICFQKQCKHLNLSTANYAVTNKCSCASKKNQHLLCRNSTKRSKRSALCYTILLNLFADAAIFRLFSQ